MPRRKRQKNLCSPCSSAYRSRFLVSRTTSRPKSARKISARRPGGEARQRRECVRRVRPGRDGGDRGSAGEAPAGPAATRRCHPAALRGWGRPEGVAVPGTDLEGVTGDLGEVKRQPGKLLPPTETPSRGFGSAVKQWARASRPQRQPASKAFRVTRA